MILERHHGGEVLAAGDAVAARNLFFSGQNLHLSLVLRHPGPEVVEGHWTQLGHLALEVVPVPVGLVVISLKVGIVKGHAARDAGESRPPSAAAADPLVYPRPKRY